ncbi:MAG TPA: DUF2231 domain-containing protein [Candidatus Binataceae bacterium]|nr:DUF2231 domain-containing protein [Candidatus Binataceae bacterium]
MQALIDTLKAWQLHPFVDHFTVSLIIVAVLVDIAASILSSRMWLRYMALTLLVLGTLAAFGSHFTGGWEADRVWDSVTGPGKDLLRRHAWWGDRLPYVFAVLALWRILLQFVGFVARSRPIYLIVAIIAAGLILYQGFLGGDLVYDYGVGTALMQTAAPIASPSVVPAAPPLSASPMPTVFVATPTPAASPTPAPAASPASATSGPTESPAASEEASPEPSSDGSAVKNL